MLFIHLRCTKQKILDRATGSVGGRLVGLTQIAEHVAR
jgi:hypothetical protein